MSGIYEGPYGEKLYGDGKVVQNSPVTAREDQPTARDKASHWSYQSREDQAFVVSEDQPRPTLNELLEKARTHIMTPEEKEAQRQSWVRGEMGLANDERGMTTTFAPRWNVGTCKKDAWPHLENECHICHDWQSSKGARLPKEVIKCIEDLKYPNTYSEEMEAWNKAIARCLEILRRGC